MGSTITEDKITGLFGCCQLVWLFIGLGYHYGKEAVKGNLLLEEYENHRFL
jgi:hypothetical protein